MEAPGRPEPVQGDLMIPRAAQDVDITKPLRDQSKPDFVCEICGLTLMKGESKYCRACSHRIDLEKERREKNQREERI
jgi:hypothetical protein